MESFYAKICDIVVSTEPARAQDDIDGLETKNKSLESARIREFSSSTSPARAKDHLDGSGTNKNTPKSAEIREFAASTSPARAKAHVDGLETNKTTLEGNQFECRWCFDVFTRIEDLVFHRGIHRATRQYLCKWCNVNFSWFGWEYHYRKHTNDKRYSCDSCNKKFYLAGQLVSHLSHHKYMCSSCDRSFVTKKQIRRHGELAHNIFLNFDLDPVESIRTRTRRAKKTIQNRVQMKIPQSQSTAVRKSNIVRCGKFECNHCGERFPKIVLLRDHMKKKRNCRPYWCNDCSAKFSQKKELEKHVRRHLYKCDSCSISFSYKYDLDMHRFDEHMLDAADYFAKPAKLETGSRCQYCDSIFLNDEELGNHISITGEDNFICARCLDVFKTEAAFRCHLRDVHQVIKTD